MTPLQLQSRATDRGFERLYRRHAPDVYRYALAVLRNPDDAEDVTQTTFMNAYRAYRNGERPKAPKNWLIAIAHNVCRQRFRLASRRPNEVEFDEELTAAVPTEDGPTAGDIRRALGHLAFNQRAALVMRELEGRSYVEIASILGLSVSAVETLIFRARRALREQLEEALTCDEAEFAISRQLDGRLPRNEKGRLRAHLRSCEDCAAVARSQRAQRSALRGLAGIPLPSSIGSFFGGGGGAGLGVAGMGVAAKVALLGSTAIVAAGVGYEGVHHKVWNHVVPSARPAQAGRPVSGAVDKPSTDLISDVRPPNAAASRKRAAVTRRAQAQNAARPVARAAATPVARVTHAPVRPAPVAAAHAARPAAAAKPKAATPKPAPAAKAKAKAAAPVAKPKTTKRTARVTPPPAAPPPASPPPATPPPATPAPAPAPPKPVARKHRRHRHHHRAVVVPRTGDDDQNENDDDDRPAAVVPHRKHKPCKPHHRHHERAKPKADDDASVEAKVPVRARHDHRDHGDHRDHTHHRATPPPPPAQPPVATPHERHHDEARDHERHDHDGGDHGRRDRRRP